MTKVTLIACTPNPVALMSLSAHCCTTDKELSLEKEEDYQYKSLNHAVESNHQSVMEHVSLTFLIEGMSRACSHQLVRHRVASISQQSQRYVKTEEPVILIPKSISKAIEKELTNGGGMSPNGCLKASLENFDKCLNDCIKRMRELGVPEEDIRYLYPQGTITNMVFTCNMRELKHIAEERLCNRAQWEIREIVKCMVDLTNQAVQPNLIPLVPKCKTLGYCPEAKCCGLSKPRPKE